ncbi:MAG: pitrilysin family protein [Bacteroidota bacterium]
MENLYLHTFPNGIRLAHKYVASTQVSHIGIMLDIGSRDEKPHQQGLAHFWEHMAFKGTKKRNSFNILNRLEMVGGELNAYTTKEKVCFHASVLKPHTDRAIELLTDIAFHSIFPDKMLDRERNVILEEMSMYYDSPEDAIQDDFDELLFANHQLGKNILGNQESVSNFTREDLLKFIDENLDTERIVIASTGNLDFKQIKKITEKYVNEIPFKKTTRNRIKPESYTTQIQQVSRKITQAQVALGRPSYGLNHKNRVPFFMIANHLGGPAMNSRFNVSLREKNGLVYSIDANYTPYVDTGFIGIYFGTEQQKIEKSLDLIRKELNLVKEKLMSSNQLFTLKNQLKGQLAMAEESNMGFMQMMAKSLLDMDKIDSLEEIFSQIEEVSANQLQDISNEMFDEKDLSSLTFLPEN